tara:strand:- start:3014 stop:5662 length:2649 start_codon:yes stop_codon:yes gene_type:complete
VNQSTPWARLGSLLVTRGHAETAAREGRAVPVYPDGLEALSYAPTFPAKASAAALRRHESYVGTLPTAGVVDMGSNTKLTPDFLRGDTSGVGLYSTMRQTDPVVRAICSAWTLPIIRSAWTVEPNGDDRPALEMAEWVRANLWEYLRGGFQGFIEQAVSAVWQGFSLFEIVVAFDRTLGKVRLDQLSPMLPRTVYEWGRFDDGRWGVVQHGYSADPDVGSLSASFDEVTAFPPDKILHFAWDGEGDNPEGCSILRPCYGGWQARKLYLKLEASGFERGAFGIPFVEVEASARAADSTQVNEILRELRTGARAWAAFPPGYTLKFADFPMKGAEIREARRAAGMDMARAALAPFLFTGEPGAGGAYALVKGHQDFFQMALQSAADMVAGVLSDGPNALIKRLVGWNFPDVKSFPYLAPGSISIGDPDKLVTAIKNAADGGILIPDRGIEEAIRSALGLPEMSEVSAEQWKHETINKSPPEVSSGAGDEPPGVDPDPPTSTLPPSGSSTPQEKEQTDDVEERIDEEAAGLEAMVDVADLFAPPKAKNGRDLRPEETIVRLDETLAPMEGVKEAMARALVLWREAIIPKYGGRVARAGELTKIQAVDVPDLGLLSQALEAELRRAYRAGRSSVKSEVERAREDPEIVEAVVSGDFETTRDGVIVDYPEIDDVLEEPHGPSCGVGCSHGGARVGLRYLVALATEEEVEDAARAGGALGRMGAGRAKVSKPKVVADGESIADDIIPDEAISQVARSTAGMAADRVKGAVVRAAQAASIGGILAPEALLGVVGSTVRSLSPGPDLNQAQADTNTIFGLGRQQEARSQGGPDERLTGIYSTMMESETCSECASFDGAIFGMDEVDTYATPNPLCLGGDKCNCILIYIPQ